MHRICNFRKRAIFIIAVFLCAILQIQSSAISLAQSEKPLDDSSLLVEGEPGFVKQKVEPEEVQIEKPKIAQGVEFYFSSMFNLFIAGGIALVVIGIYSATKKNK